VNDVQPERIPRIQQGLGGNYTQVNILFPSEQVELPAAEKFTAFPPEAQKAILAAFEREQIERHAWLKNQQANEHQFNMQSGRHYFYWKIAGVFGGVILALGALFTGAWLATHGASAIGTSIMIAAVAGLVGTAIYGHKANESPKTEDESTTAAVKKTSN
jgi:uncharacterized membrane protein